MISSFNSRFDFGIAPEAVATAAVPTHLLLAASLRESHTFELYAFVLRARGVSAQFLPFECSANDLSRLSDLLSAMRRSATLETIMVSDPFKIVVASLVDELSETALRCGAVNLVTKKNGLLVGDNLDGAAFNRGMSALDRVSIQSRSIAFFGCGGVSTAVALANAQGLERVGLYDIAENKSVALRERILSLNPEVDVSIVPAEPRRDLRGYDVLYNGTGLGKFPHLSDSPLAENDLLDASLFIDAIYTPSETTFLSRGRVAGARAVNGLSHMLASTAFHCSVIGGVEIDVSEVEAAHRSLFEPA